jgi:2-polyprenyl-3-methyl-5-hydroxy-6-metoxy-1,4-benzoquinol methylase
VAACCARGCDVVFDEKSARKAAKRYRERGLRGTGATIVRLVRERGVGGAEVLEIGGGIGALGLELLRAGAARATTVELSPGYEEPARELARDSGLDDRVDRRLGDVAEQPHLADPADVVVLDAVVCCYPDYERLLSAAASRARRLLVFSYPPRHLLMRGLIAIANAWPALRGREFRGFAHPPDAMLAVVERHGLRRVADERTLLWRITVLEAPERPLASRP